MYCPECKQEYEGKFCPECGTKLIERVVKICPNCGVEREGKFCPECGTKLVEQNQASVSISIGDANAINGNVNISNTVNASCNADVLGAMGNESVVIGDGNAISGGLNISNTKNIYYSQKNELEMIQENKERFMALFKKAYEDGELDASEICELEMFRSKNGLDDVSNEYYRQALKLSGKTKIDLLQKAADLCHPAACCCLGECYWQGEGVRKDGIEAIRWWRIAAAFGEATAYYNLGRIYYDGDEVVQDYEAAAEWFAKAAGKNYADSAFRLGLCHYQLKDYEKAVKSFRKAVERNDADAMCHLGCCYDEGVGVEPDYQEALRLWLKAAEKNEPTSCYNLGDIYLNGRPGVEKSSKDAMAWFLKAHELGYESVAEEIKKTDELYWTEHADDYSTKVSSSEHGLVDEQGAEYLFNKLLRIRDKSITSLHVAEGTRIIGDEVFRLCKNLSELIIPEGVVSIGSKAFYGCSSLKSITLPSTLREIGDGAFWSCRNLSELIIPEGVESIGSNAFWSCSLLKSITLPSTLREIGDEAFMFCDKLSELIIPEGVVSIGSEAFKMCNSLKSITLSSTLKEIGNGAFYCSNLEEVVIPRCIESIVKSRVFYSSTKLVYVD